MNRGTAVSLLFTAIALACSSNSDNADFNQPGSSGTATRNAAGTSATASGSAGVAGATTGGSVSFGGTSVPGGSNGEGGELVGAGGRAFGGAHANGPGGEGGAAPTADPRPACEDAQLVQLSAIRLVEGAGPGETATLAIDVTNNTPEFVSHNAITFACDGGAVESAYEKLTVFGTLPGDTISVDLLVTFQDSAQSGETAVCTARGTTNESPDDCANAQVSTFLATVE